MACGEGLNLTALVTEIIILYVPKYIVYSEKRTSIQHIKKSEHNYYNFYRHLKKITKKMRELPKNMTPGICCLKMKLLNHQ